jgi:Tfp pilus assembly protein PilO
MGSGHNRLWLIGGALGAVALLAVGWFFLINPQHERASSLREKAAAEELKVVSLRHRLAELKQQKNNLSEYEGQLARDRQALPKTSGLSDFLRELQAAGDHTGVSVSGVIVGAPNEASAGSGVVFALPISLNVSGTVAQLSSFLDQLQRVQPRAVLIMTANAASADQGGTLSGQVNLGLTLQAFVASADAPTTAATPSPAKS